MKPKAQMTAVGTNSCPPLQLSWKCSKANLPAVNAGVVVPPSAEVVAAGEDQIQQWLQSRGANALPGLLGKLDSGSAEVRANALEALKQLGDRQAIPALQQKAEVLLDPDEKARFLAAADFLAMPKYGEK